MKNDAKGPKGRWRADFINPDGTPKKNIYRGELSNDGKTIQMVGEFNVESGKFRNGHKERKININYVNILNESDSEQLKKELSFNPVTNNVWDCTESRIIGQLVFNKDEKVSEAAGREWYCTSDHTRKYYG